MSYNPQNPNSQANMANSSPVVIASDQSAVLVSGTVTATPTGTQTVSGTVTANAGTNLNTSALALETGGNLASIKSNTDNLALAQGSPTTGQLGNLAQGAVTNSAPSYTTAQTSPLSLTTAGALRTDASATTQPVSGTVTSNIGTTNGLALDATLTGGTQQSKLVDSAGTNLASISAGGALKVDASSVAVPITDNSGSLTVDNGGTFAVQATVAAGATNVAKAEDVASADADVGIPSMAVRKATPANTSGTDGDYEMLQMSAGRLWTSSTIDAALPAGTALVGKVGIDQTTPGTTNAVTNVPATAGGWSIMSVPLVSAASTNPTVVKASAGQLGGWYIYNGNAAARKVAFHNSGSSPTAGTGVVFAVMIPPTAGANVEFTNGIAFSSGIAITTVTGPANSNATAVAADDLIINILFK